MLMSHSLRETLSSYDSSDDRFTFKSSQYSPLTLATSAEEARYTTVFAPSFALFMKILGTDIMNPAGPKGRLQILVATVPGWTEFAVTPVPRNLFASSC